MTKTEEVKSELDARGIEYNPKSPYPVLAKLLSEHETGRDEAASPVVERPKVTPVKPGDMKPRGMLNAYWETYVPASSLDSLEDPAMWVFMGPRWKQGDEVRVTADNYTWVAKGYVTYAMGRDVRITFTDIIELGEQQEQEINYGPYLIRNGGAIRRYYIMRADDGTIIHEGSATIIDAIKYIQDQQRANSRIPLNA